MREQRTTHAATPGISTPPSTLARSGTSNGRQANDRPFSSHLPNNVGPKDAIGQFSYGPTTQTTVVTTTTTTTTKFPPLMLRAPRHLHNLDPKKYPLAASPTPQSIKKLVFELDGKSTTFQESEDTLQTIQKLHEQERILAESNGSFRSISRLPTASVAQARFTSSPKPSSLRALSPLPKVGIKRSASPVSIIEAARIAAQEGPRKKRLTAKQKRHQVASVQDEDRSSIRRPHLQTLQTSTPITPYADGNRSAGSQQIADWRVRSNHESAMDAQISASSSATCQNSVFEDEPQILSPRSDDARSDQGASVSLQSHSFTGSDISTEWQGASPAAAGTSSFGNNRESFNGRLRYLPFASERSQPHSRPRPHAVDTTAAQDASLPSPSLSPVTAAAQIHARSSRAENIGSDVRYREGETSHLAQSHRHRSAAIDNGSGFGQASNSAIVQSRQGSLDVADSEACQNQSNRSLMCIPQVVDDFESMPEEIKKYVIHQLLRRCSKPVLHFVADIVNPALKCDFLKQLPPELCEVILGHVDVKSLCAAAQVSKKWQQQVDLSEKVWRRHFYEDGYTLQEGELARAIREGWGWQTICEPNDGEKDLSLLITSSSDAGPSATVSRESTNVLQRPRRRGKAKAKSSSKLSRRRKHLSLLDTSGMDEDALLVMTSATDGPYAAASAAAAAISLPRSDLHLWKSIYMRHHIIRRTWLRHDVAPRHIAFRAHQGHVVTCLQFDSEKILTGSDDANINVYDTQTGALRAKLEGHEGGVWALQYEGNMLVSGSTDRSVRVWDIEHGVCTHTFQGHTSTVRCLQILLPSPIGTGTDGRPEFMPKQPLIITGSRDSQLRVWKLPKPGDPHLHQTGLAQDENTESLYHVRTLTGHINSVRAIAAHADTLVSGSYDCTVRVWKISTGETLHRLQGHAQKVYSVVLDIKRNRCISGSMDNVVKVWSLDAGMMLFNLEGHSSLVGLLDLQQDRLVSAAADSTLRIWDPENGQCKSILTAHTGAITCFQHDGQKVISGSDRTLKMWNVGNGEFVRDLLTDLSGVWQVKFNERQCVAAVQRNNLTYIEVLDFGACRDGVPESKRGRRIVVDPNGRERLDGEGPNVEVDFIEAN